MIDESNLLNFYCTGIYDSSRALTETEIVMKVLERLNLVILNFNNLENQTLNNMKKLEKQVDYYMDTGIKEEVSKKLNEMIDNGYFNSVINNNLLYELNNQVNEINEDINMIKQHLGLSN